MAYAHRQAFVPIATINITPLIDVMLVLLIMLIILIPLAEHSLDVDLPGESPPPPTEQRSTNTVAVTESGQILWNGTGVNEGQLVSLLRASLRPAEPPPLLFEPEANAGYAESAKVIRLIKLTGVTKFAFVGNERHRVFARAH